jgi:hypothetical protein
VEHVPFIRVVPMPAIGPLVPLKAAFECLLGRTVGPRNTRQPRIRQQRGRPRCLLCRGGLGTALNLGQQPRQVFGQSDGDGGDPINSSQRRTSKPDRHPAMLGEPFRGVRERALVGGGQPIRDRHEEGGRVTPVRVRDYAREATSGCRLQSRNLPVLDRGKAVICWEKVVRKLKTGEWVAVTSPPIQERSRWIPASRQ